MENEQKKLSEDRRGMWFPLSVALACFVLALIIMVYVLNMSSGGKYEYIELPNGFKLVQSDECWIVDKDDVAIIGADITHINAKDGFIYYKRKNQDQFEVGRYDTKLRYFTDITYESYDDLEKKFGKIYGVKLLKIGEYKKNGDSQ